MLEQRKQSLRAEKERVERKLAGLRERMAEKEKEKNQEEEARREGG
jgi:hypothetical protein